MAYYPTRLVACHWDKHDLRKRSRIIDLDHGQPNGH